MVTSYGSPFCRYVIADVSVTTGEFISEVIATTAVPGDPTLYMLGEGAIDTTMYLSGWITLLLSVSIVMLAVVLPGASVNTGLGKS
jgi:hypothetical protein